MSPLKQSFLKNVLTPVRLFVQAVRFAGEILAHRLAPGALMGQVRHLLYKAPFYRLTLVGKTPTEIRSTVPDPRPGTAEKARPIIEGQAPWNDGEKLWTEGEASDVVMGPHGFRWLADMRADDSDNARVRARHLVEDWIENHKRWSGLAWAPGTIAERLTHWLTSAGFLFTGSDEVFRKHFLASIAAQARHLARACGDERNTNTFLAIKGLVYVGLTLPGGSIYLDRALTLLEGECARQILADGGHLSRRPETMLDVLRQLVDMRAGLVAANIGVPSYLQNAIDRMTPMIRALRLGDGTLALFNGGREGDPTLIDAILAQAAVRGQPILSAPMSGFQRVQALRTTLLIDTGMPPPYGFDENAHAGTLSFEMSVGRDRLIVNCGAHPFGPAEWTDALRGTAAHSTLTLESTNSSAIISGFGITGRRARTLSVIRREDDGDTWLETSHDGYFKPFGLVHARHIYVAADGEEVRGRDSLVGTHRGPFHVRFHLHPDVSASVVEGGSQVLLKLPSGQGWRFRASGGVLSLEESAYFGHHGAAALDGSHADPQRRAQQIVIACGPDNIEATVKWRLALEPR